MQISPIRNTTSSSPVLATNSEGHRLEKDAELTQLIVTRRDAASNDPGTPREAMNKGNWDQEAISNAAAELNKLMGLIDKKLEFAVHDKTRRVMVQVINSTSGDILSEFPSEKMLDLHASLVEAIGIAVDERI